MVKTINELTSEATSGDVSNDDLLVIYDNSGSPKTKKVTRGNLLHDVAFENGDHDFGTSEIDDLTATAAAVSNSFAIGGGDAISKLYVKDLSFTFTSISAGAGQTQTDTITGISAADYLSWAMTAALDDGLIAQAWISGANTVSLTLFNTTGSPIVPGTLTMRATVIDKV